MRTPNIFFTTALLLLAPGAWAQSQATQQLAFDIQKLAQFKQTLTKMYQGYQVISTGYSRVKTVTQGHYSLNKLFLDKLMGVSPIVRKYKRVGDIMTAESRILSQTRSSFRVFSQGSHFSPRELTYIKGVFTSLEARSAADLDALLTVVTADKLRMTDAERLHEIDRIWGSASESSAFLSSFTNQAAGLNQNRAREMQDISTMSSLNGLTLK